jgi:hypothetical protein
MYKFEIGDTVDVVVDKESRYTTARDLEFDGEKAIITKRDMSSPANGNRVAYYSIETEDGMRKDIMFDFELVLNKRYSRNKKIKDILN